MHYLDNNATTRTCNESRREVSKWLQACSNPSGSSKLSAKAQQLLDRTRAYVRKLINAPDYDIIFTSGATESNCLFIRSITDAWLRRGIVPHVIVSSVEHKSILECVAQLLALRRVQVSIIRPDYRGIIQASSLDGLFRPNTAMVSIIGAGNETGAINPLQAIATKCRSAKVPLHSDCVQLFGKYKLDIQDLGLSAMSMSFHKIYGPMGIGMLILNHKLVIGYKLEGQLTGTQEGGLRGGTENVPGIAGGAMSLICNFRGRTTKNRHLIGLKSTFIRTLSQHFTVMTDVDLSDIEAKIPTSGIVIVILGPPPLDTNLSLPNTILLSMLCRDRIICNGKLKTILEKMGYIVSIGSACNTASSRASHILDGLRAPMIVKRGTIRISFGDYNTIDEAKGIANAMHLAIDRDIWQTKK
jgi:cysteine desulfurase